MKTRPLTLAALLLTLTVIAAAPAIAETSAQCSEKAWNRFQYCLKTHYPYTIFCANDYKARNEYCASLK